MFSVGKKDQNGQQVRVEHRGKNVRASRTGGVAVRGQKKVAGVTLTANSKRGVRASKKVAKGTRIAVQNGRFQLIGRWSKGPLNFNLSKSGGSVSAKNKRGSFNITNPRRSSFKMGGVQVRGQRAAQLQLLYLMFRLALFLTKTAIWLVLFPILLLIDLITWAVRRSSAPQPDLEA